MEHRIEMVLCYHYNGMAHGVRKPNVLHGYLNPCHSKYGLQTAGG